jgi:hypothetical protein
VRVHVRGKRARGQRARDLREIVMERSGRGGRFALPYPSHTTGRAGPHPAVRKVEVHPASLGTPRLSKWLTGRAMPISRPEFRHQLLVFRATLSALRSESPRARSSRYTVDSFFQCFSWSALRRWRIVRFQVLGHVILLTQAWPGALRPMLRLKVGGCPATLSAELGRVERSGFVRENRPGVSPSPASMTSITRIAIGEGAPVAILSA